MCCLVGIMALLGPRFALAFWWIFGNKVDAVFNSWIWPLLGLIFIPWTTLFYVLAWGAVNGVSGWGWVLVAIGFMIDVSTYAAKPARSRYQT